MYGSGAVSCSCSLLIRGPNLARCQAEAPLIALCRFPKPALLVAVIPAVQQAQLGNVGRETSDWCRPPGDPVEHRRTAMRRRTVGAAHPCSTGLAATEGLGDGFS